MIVRRYGSTIRSVVPNFDSLAMTEIGFQRTSDLSLSAEEFAEQYERVEERALVATAEGEVKVEAEQALLDDLLAQVAELRESLAEEMLILVESQPGRDYPKLRDQTKVRVVGGIENRLHFIWTVDPPLRLGVYRRRAAASS
jgi:hypothetical protein